MVLELGTVLIQQLASSFDVCGRDDDFDAVRCYGWRAPRERSDHVPIFDMSWNTLRHQPGCDYVSLFKRWSGANLFEIASHVVDLCCNRPCGPFVREIIMSSGCVRMPFAPD